MYLPIQRRTTVLVGEASFLARRIGVVATGGTTGGASAYPYMSATSNAWRISSRESPVCLSLRRPRSAATDTVACGSFLSTGAATVAGRNLSEDVPTSPSAFGSNLIVKALSLGRIFEKALCENMTGTGWEVSLNWGDNPALDYPLS